MYNSNDMYGNNYGNYYNPYNYMNYYNMNPNYIRDYGPEPFILNINEVTKQNLNEYKCRRKHSVRNAPRCRPVYTN